MARKREASFVSKADTQEMREYQMTASQYPPLPREKFVRTSREFVRGRRAAIDLEESDMLDSLLGGDWSIEHVAEARERVVAGFRERVEALNELGETPKDVHDIMVRDAEELADAYDLFVSTHRYDDRTRRSLEMTRANGDRALARMVNHNLQFAMACVGRMMKKNRRAKMIGAKELIAVANVGLVLGARQYDPDSGRAFTTYAAYHINGQLYDYLNKEDGNVGIRAATLHEQKQILAIRQIEESFAERYGRKPSVREVASLSLISQDKVLDRLAMPTIRTQSIFVKGKGEGDEDREVFLPDLAGDGPTADDDLASNSRDEALGIAHAALAAMDWPQSAIIRMATGMDNDGEKPMSCRQIARELGLSQYVVERDLRKGLQMLQGRILENGIDGDRIFADDFDDE